MRHMKITDVFPLCKFSSLPSWNKGSLPSPFFQRWKQINIQCSVLQHCLGEEGGVTTGEKGVFIQIQNSTVSAKALVKVNCLNTSVHNFRVIPSRKWKVCTYCHLFSLAAGLLRILCADSNIREQVKMFDGIPICLRWAQQLSLYIC